MEKVTDRNNLERVARSLKLDDFVNNNRSQGNTVQKGTVVSTLQALLGAVFLDSAYNLDTLKAVLKKLGLDGTN